MKAYLITTGTIFALIALLHVLRGFVEPSSLTKDVWHFLEIVGLGVLAAGLSVWAWCLLKQHRTAIRRETGD